MEQSRRKFFGTLAGGIAAAAAVKTWPFRVYSFPSEIRIAGIPWHDGSDPGRGILVNPPLKLRVPYRTKIDVPLNFFAFVTPAPCRSHVKPRTAAT